MSNELNPSDLIECVKNSLYQPVISETDASQTASTFLDSKAGKAHYKFSMYHLLVSNYIVNGVFTGNITEEEKHRLLKIGSTKAGLEKLSAHVILSYSGSYNHYDNINVVQEIVFNSDNTGLDNTFVVEH